MASLVYPGIWGCLQPVQPNVEYATSALYPMLVPDAISIPQPGLDSDSMLRVVYFNPVTRDTMFLGACSITGGSLIATIVYRNTSAADSINLSRLTITSGSLTTFVNAVARTFGEFMNLGALVITPASSLIVTVVRATLATAETMNIGPLVITSGSLTTI